MKKCVINFSDGGGNGGGVGQQRLFDSLIWTGFKDPIFLWKDHKDLGCPSHKEVPYGFKPYALQRAYEEGFELVFWCDASVWAIKSTDSVFEYLQNHSHLFFYNACLGAYTSDACLTGFNIDRDAAIQMPMIMGICMGFNLTNPVTREFLKQWLAKAKDGFSFQGSHWNDQYQVSKDSRCNGHRHDQSVSSIIACNLGMKELLIAHQTFLAYWQPEVIEKTDSIVFAAQGIPSSPALNEWRSQRTKSCGGIL